MIFEFIYVTDEGYADDEETVYPFFPECFHEDGSIVFNWTARVLLWGEYHQGEGITVWDAMGSAFRAAIKWADRNPTRYQSYNNSH